MSHLAERSQPWLPQSEEEAPAVEAVSLAQVLAGGGDPAPQLIRAKALLSALGGPGGLLRASPEQLAAVGVLEAQEMALLIAVQRVVGSRYPAERPEIGSFRALQTFLRTEMAGIASGETRALLLDHRHRLTADVSLARGDHPLTYDQHQDLVRSCLEHCASGVIIARWICRADPSVHDLTREANVVARSLEMLTMRLLDYVLVGTSEIRRVRWCQSSAFTSKAVMS